MYKGYAIRFKDTSGKQPLYLKKDFKFDNHLYYIWTNTVSHVHLFKDKKEAEAILKQIKTKYTDTYCRVINFTTYFKKHYVTKWHMVGERPSGCCGWETDPMYAGDTLYTAKAEPVFIFRSGKKLLPHFSKVYNTKAAALADIKKNLKKYIDNQKTYIKTLQKELRKGEKHLKTL